MPHPPRAAKHYRHLDGSTMLDRPCQGGSRCPAAQLCGSDSWSPMHVLPEALTAVAKMGLGPLEGMKWIY